MCIRPTLCSSLHPLGLLGGTRARLEEAAMVVDGQQRPLAGLRCRCINLRQKQVPPPPAHAARRCHRHSHDLDDMRSLFSNAEHAPLVVPGSAIHVANSQEILRQVVPHRARSPHPHARAQQPAHTIIESNHSKIIVSMEAGHKRRAEQGQRQSAGRDAHLNLGCAPGGGSGNSSFLMLSSTLGLPAHHHAFRAALLPKAFYIES